LFERFCKYVGAVSESGQDTSAPPREAKKQKHKHVLIKQNEERRQTDDASLVPASVMSDESKVPVQK
jgi:hypothetical protein